MPGYLYNPYYYYYYGYDGILILLILGVVLLSVFAQIAVWINFRKYSKVRTHRGITGADAAREILRQQGIYNIQIERVGGRLSDHYDPKHNVIRLSPDVYDSSSIAALGVAAHEAGHAMQHAAGYAPLKLRNSVFPIVNIGSYAAFPILIIGFILNSFNLLFIGVICMALVVLFQLVTLPVEFNASRNAISALSAGNILYEEELPGARRVLGSAALTYIAAFASALVNLLRFVAILNRRN